MKAISIAALVLILSSCTSNTPTISKIGFKAGACFGMCPVFTMNVSEDGTATYHAGEYNKQQGDFKTVIKNSQLDSLKLLVQNANIISLKNYYFLEETDHATFTLEVQFSNGEHKIIEDYGPSAPKELGKIYALFFSLRKTQDWK